VKRTGDRETARLLDARVKDIIDWFDGYRNADGLLEKLPSWVFLGWDAVSDYPQDVSYPANMLFAVALETAGGLYGRPDWCRQAAQMKATVRVQSFDGTRFRDHAVRTATGALDVRPEATETCQYYAFFSGTADYVREAALWKLLVEGSKAAFPKAGLFPGVQMRFICLQRAGRIEQAKAEALAYYRSMAEKTGTLWEHDTPSASCCHAFATGFVRLFADEIRE
jgi:hypothetical protein